MLAVVGYYDALSGIDRVCEEKAADGLLKSIIRIP